MWGSIPFLTWAIYHTTSVVSISNRLYMALLQQIRRFYIKWYNASMTKKSTKNTPTKWILTDLYKSDNDPKMQVDLEKSIQEAEKFSKKWKSNTKYLEDPKELKIALDDYNDYIENRLYADNVMYYLILRSSQDESDTKIKALLNKASDVYTKVVNEIQFFSLSISKIDKKLQSKFLQSKELADYHHFIKRLFDTGAHNLSDAEEKIMNLKSKTSLDNWVSMVSEFIYKEEREVLDENSKKAKKTFSQILTLTGNKNKKVRKLAGENIEEILEKHVDLATVEINNVLENKKVNDMIRNFERPDSSAHLRHDMNTEVVDAITDAVTSRFDISKKYYKFKAKMLGQDKLDYYERSAVYDELKTKFSYQKSIDTIYNVFSELDGEFFDITKYFVDTGKIDVFPYKGKTGGAFCIGNSFSRRTSSYILLNHTNTLNDVLTIAHELGHGIHNEIARKNQNQLNFGTTTSTAEVASTFMEDFVLEKLLKQANDEEKLIILMQKLDADMQTIFRQIACYNFELAMHNDFREHGYLSKEHLQKLFKKHMNSYMGSASKGCENWWVYWSHLRMYFYVYTYSSGLLISKALQAGVKKDPTYVSKVKEFLGAGISDSPRNIFNNVGIDITNKSFWHQGLNEVEELFKQTKLLAKKLGKI